jgi:isopenicillin N synthase-like dioxygenase
VSGIPVVELASPEAVEQTRRACEEAGFLAVVGHGVDEGLVDRLDELAQEFFALEEDEKRTLVAGEDAVAGLPAYRPVASERLAAGSGDLKESLDWGPEVPGTAWPERPAGLREAILDYHGAVSTLAARLRRTFAQALGLGEDWFEPAFTRHASSLRVIHYGRPEGEPEPGQLGAGAHTDYGFLTILRSPDDPGGLQVRTRDDEWLDVAAPAGSFVVNIGDLAQRWTNDRWQATPHRVLPATSDRRTIVFFHDPSPDSVIEVIPTCVGDGRRYDAVTALEHIRARAAAALG